MATTSKKTLRALACVFMAEVENRLPFQSRAAIYKQLEAVGMLERTKRMFGSGPLTATVEGYTLSHLGRMTYCASCEGEDKAGKA